ncbi:hypothetical protein [Nannocystis pusilla]|uniref:Uncharacterized protein n=1 Tax=Nannocystis pusilla TaxID=889268 RepID=A0ABS7U333_9BACT|nr:hypothetical protein [Nannocystis pusilla]MBZ5714860.1 hypothetical protein [Nannocystis pusilla]
MRSLASLTLVLVASSLFSACSDEVAQSTDGVSTSGSSADSAATEPGTSTSNPGTSTGEPTSTDPTTTTTTAGSTTELTATTAATTETTDGTSTGSTGTSTTGEPAAVCCEPPLCGDPSIEACVCASDPSCCQGPWTGECASLVVELGCGWCPTPEGPCCEVGAGPGCTDDAIERCVCAQLPDCCGGVWGAECVAAVDTLGCGACEEPPKGECCEAHRGGGCLDVAVESCVCNLAPECCAGAWTEACVALVDQSGCGTCEVGEGDCCMPQDGPGCGEPQIATCVCAQDPFCCQQQWDGVCAEEVEALGCGVCQAGPGDCCVAGEGPGCVDPAVQACVCAVAPSCCQQQWTDACAALVEPLGCGLCGVPGEAECCEPHDSPSCDDATIAECVCAQDPFCCAGAWDQGCVAEVEALGCGMCGGPSENTCCETHGTPECDDAAITQCVCAQDPFCCDVQWDQLCVAEVESLGCGMCEAPSETTCCEEHGTPECDDAAITQCVCAQDPFCCDVQWDGLCVSEVESLGCGMCG